MFIVAVYDIQVKRIQRVRQVMGKYLHAVQNSVFEGHLTAKQLGLMKQELQKIAVPSEDSILIYKYTQDTGVIKEQLGQIRKFPFIL